MTDTSQLERKLDLLIALTRVGVREDLNRELRTLQADPASLEILQRSEDWTPAGELKTAVRAATSQSEPTVKRRIAELVSRGALQRRGAGGSVSYRATGLFEV
jgi:predicted HTH transcriptional regulator